MSDENVEKKVDELSGEFEEMFETMQAIKGEKFCDFVSFVMNQGSLLKLCLIACSESAEAEENILLRDDSTLKMTFLRVLSHTTKAHAEALGLPENEIAEAMKFSENMTAKIQRLENSLEDE